MPTRNAQGTLIASVQSGKVPKVSTVSMPPKQRWMLLAVTFAVLGVLIFSVIGASWYAIPALRRGLSVAAQRRDLDSMKSIVVALNDYNARYGTYPTPIVSDVTGKPLYSWRVLILPFLGYEDLFQRFQLDQAWDSPANLALLNEMPSVFASSNAPDAQANHEPNFVLLVGTGTAFPPTGPMSAAQITDDPTVLLVETKAGGIVWTQPGDIDIGKFGVNLGSISMQNIGGQHATHVVAVDRNGRGMRIPKTTPKLVLEALVTPTSGEKIEGEAFAE